MASTNQAFECLLDSWQWVGVLSVGIKMAESMQKCRLPAFSQTSTTVLHHTLWLGQIVPESNISCRCAWTSTTNGRGIFKQGIIGDFIHIFSSMSVAELTWFQGEDVMVLSQE